jgi:hypothetical protein
VVQVVGFARGRWMVNGHCGGTAGHREREWNSERVSVAQFHAVMLGVGRISVSDGFNEREVVLCVG